MRISPLAALIPCGLQVTASKLAPNGRGITTFTRPQCSLSCLAVWGSVMELFRAEKVATVVDQATKTCRFCDEKLRHVRAVVISDTGAVIHMFECRCGERTWTD